MWTLSTVCGDHAGDRPPHMETPDAAFDRRRHDILHDTRTVHILRRLGHLPKLYLLTFIFGIFTPKMPPVALSKNQKLTSAKRLLAFSHVKMLYFPRKNTKKMTFEVYP